MDSMKNRIFLCVFIAFCALSCSVADYDKPEAYRVPQTLYATLEQTSSPETKVYVDAGLKLHWDANDLINAFAGYNYGFRYRYQGESGSTSGEFVNEESDTDTFVVGDGIDYTCAVYPYVDGLQLDYDKSVIFTLPSTQVYRENSFGKGASTMISMGEKVAGGEIGDLTFKHVCGYLALKVYGDNISVSSITIKGNNGEIIAGESKIAVALDASPSVKSFTKPEYSITLKCDDPVTVGNTAETATVFWLVIPPTNFEKGFTVTVKDNNRVSEKSTSRSIEIKRSCLTRMAPFKVEY